MKSRPELHKTLTDGFGRQHRYLRLSLTDRCNLRCGYCMPEENTKFLNRKYLMSVEEMIDITSVFVSMGVEKVRLTGGEPTLRRELPEIVAGIRSLGITPSITTNGVLLHRYLDCFQKEGLNSLNISIDTINAKKFENITRRNEMARVMENIGVAMERNFNVKLNAVVIRHFNDDEINELIRWAGELNAEIRFIEYMPFFGNSWDYEKVFTEAEILRRIGDDYHYEKLQSAADSTSVNYIIPELGARFGIISTVSNPFCKGCSRLRLTADGKMKNCLFSKGETDLLSAYRRNEYLEELIYSSVLKKKESAAGRIDFRDEKAKTEYSRNRSMVSIGG